VIYPHRQVWQVFSAISRPPTQLLSITQPGNPAMLSVPQLSPSTIFQPVKVYYNYPFYYGTFLVPYVAPQPQPSMTQSQPQPST
jgi:hypothetical protein